MIFTGNALDILRRMPDECVHVTVTSSPYYGLRAYGTNPIIWGGDPHCNHDWTVVHPPGYRGSDTNPGPMQHDGNKNRDRIQSNFCSKCGAWRGELGHEPTPELFIEHLTEIYHEVYRVTRDDGIFWCNIGDGYARNSKKGGSGTPTGRNNRGEEYSPEMIVGGKYKEKDLLEIPSMLATALRDDGWYLRARIPWIKRNSMPNSVTDRPGSSIEYFFLLSKSGDTLFWTHPSKPAVRKKPEPDYIYKNRKTDEITTTPPEGWKDLYFEVKCDDEDPETGNVIGTVKKRLWKRVNLWKGHDYFYDHVAVMQKSSESYNKDKRPRGELRQRVNPGGKYPNEGQFKKQDNVGNNTYTGFNGRWENPGTGLRFMRDSDFFFRTWNGLLQNENGEPVALVVNPKGYKEVHFATFPVRLIEPLILAGTSGKGVCPKCGAPWVRTTEKGRAINNSWAPGTRTRHEESQGQHGESSVLSTDTTYEVVTTGWVPSCDCGIPYTTPATVLDPFNGAGTTGVCCKIHGRKYIGIELNPEYVKMSNKRIEETKVE